MAKHEWFYCGECGPAVRCGHCGNNCCNPGGKPGSDCECEDARKLQSQYHPPRWMLVRHYVEDRIIARIYLRYSNAVWAVQQAWKKLRKH